MIDWLEYPCADPEQLRADLEAARTLIADPRRWVKGTPRRQTLHGMAFCAVGALDHVTGRQSERFVNGFTALGQQLPPQWPSWLSVVCFNDDRNTRHVDVLDLFDRAIKAVVG